MPRKRKILRMPWRFFPLDGALVLGAEAAAVSVSLLGRQLALASSRGADGPLHWYAWELGISTVFGRIGQPERIRKYPRKLFSGAGCNNKPKLETVM
jgi:hypothetical protein